MTNEEALQELKEAMEEQCGNIAFYGDAILKAIEALEKQIPKKPIDKGWLYCECGLQMVMVSVQDGRRYNYCPICGQRIDFGDEDD